VVAPGREAEANALIVLEKGFGKRTPLLQFKLQLRGGMGIRAASVTERTGHIIGMRLVYGEDYDVILASSRGQMIRLALASVKKLQRDTQGVTLMRMNQGDKVTSVTVIRKDATDKLEIPDEPKGTGDEEEGEGIASENIEAPAEIVDEEIEETDKEPKATRPKPAKGKNISQQVQTKGQETADIDAIPDWAKAHSDSWREPSIFKPKKNIKVHNYSDKIGSADGGQKKEDSEPKIDYPPKKRPSEPNYWGGRL